MIDFDTRAERILDAAEDLLVNHGYERTSGEEITRRAGVGAGTLYLHWKRLELLFHTVILREVVRVHQEQIRLIRRDPREALLHRFTRANFMIVTGRPLANALTTADGELLGRLAVARPSVDYRTTSRQVTTRHLDLLRGNGLLRADVDRDTQAYTLDAATSGFLRVRDAAAVTAPPGRAQRADLLAALVRRAFEPPDEPDPRAVEDVAHRLLAVVTEAAEAHEHNRRSLMLTRT